MKLPAVLLPLLAACAANRSVEPGVALQVEDRPGRRLVSVEVERLDGALEVSGVLHGSRLDTPDRRTVRIEILDASGQPRSSREIVARAHVAQPRRQALDRARFRVEVPDPGSSGSLRVQVAGD